METIEFAGHKFQYEKLHEDRFKKGVCAFRMVDEDGDTQYLVFIPRTLSECDKEIKTPNDGRMCAACIDEISALMVASSIGIASSVAKLADTKAKAVTESVEEIAKGLGFDVDALRSEVNKLRKEGKSAEEVREILKPRMEEFRKKNPQSDTKGGEW